MSQTKVKSGLIDFTEGIDSFIEFSGGNSTVTGNLTVTGTLVGYTPTASLNISNWDTAYGWGNHASAGYLTSFDITTQTDAKYLRSDESDTMAGSLTVTGGLTVDTNTLFVDSVNNRVGIGTASPSYNIQNTGTFGFATDITGNIGVFGANTATADTYFTLRNTAGRFDVGTSATGHYFYGVGVLPMQFFTNATERMRIAANGNVGIGTTSPGVPLEINSAGTELRLRYNATTYTDFRTDFINQVSAGPNSWQFQFNSNPLLHIQSTGNVGIGTTSPGQKLHVSGNIYATGYIQGGIATASAYGGYAMFGSNSSATPIAFGLDGTQYNMVINTSGNVGIGTTSPARTLHVMGQAAFDMNGTGVIIQSDGITSQIVSYKQTGSTYADLHLRGANLGIVITGINGNVGIGTTLPFRKFQVDGHAGVRNGSFFIGDESGSTDSGIEFYKSGTTLRMYTNTGAFGGTYGSLSANLDLFDGGTYSTRISGNGNSYFGAGSVGIGTTNPGAKLEINNSSNSPSPIIMKLNGDGNSQGVAHNYKLVQHYPAVSSGNKLIIPFTSQGNLNGSTIVKIWGHSAMWNARLPKAFSAEFAVGHLTVLSDLTILSSTGNISSISIAGMNIEIDFASAYTSATANGLYLTLEYMTYIPAYSIIVENITMN